MSQNGERHTQRVARRGGLVVWALGGVLLGLPLLLGGSPLEEGVPAEMEFPSAAGNVVFPHLFHVDELGVECQDCHHETLASPLGMPHPEYLTDFWIDCEGCHRSGEPVVQPRACGACHVESGDIADQSLSSKVAIHRSCWVCHEIGTGVEASGGCALCHEEADEERSRDSLLR